MYYQLSKIRIRSLISVKSGIRTHLKSLWIRHSEWIPRQLSTPDAGHSVRGCPVPAGQAVPVPVLSAWAACAGRTCAPPRARAQSVPAPAAGA